MKSVLIAGIAALSLLAGCGVDGAPMRPEKTATTQPGVSVTGDAIVGVRYDSKK